MAESDVIGPQASNSDINTTTKGPSALLIILIAICTGLSIYILMYFPITSYWFYVKAITILLLMIISYSVGKESGKIVISNEISDILHAQKNKLEDQL